MSPDRADFWSQTYSSIVALPHLNDIDDVNVTTKADKWLLYWDATAELWKAQAISNYSLADLGTSNLGDLADVDVPSPTSLYILYWNATNSRWECQSIGAYRLDELAVPTSDIAMNSKGITGLRAAIANGEALRYEQLIGLYLLLTGGTLSGNLGIGANSLETTNLALYEVNQYGLAIKNPAKTVWKNIDISAITARDDVSIIYDGKAFQAPNADDCYSTFKARDTGVGRAEVARLQGAADPYFQMTLPMVLSPGSEPGTVVEGHLWYHADGDRIKYRQAAATKTLANQDELYDVSHTEQAYALDTVYQNSTKTRFVVVSIRLPVTTTDGATLDGYSEAKAYTDASNPPTTVVGHIYNYPKDVSVPGAGDFLYIASQLSFIVQPSHYYKVVSGKSGDGGDPLIVDWHEWDLH